MQFFLLPFIQILYHLLPNLCFASSKNIFLHLHFSDIIPFRHQARQELCPILMVSHSYHLFTALKFPLQIVDQKLILLLFLGDRFLQPIQILIHIQEILSNRLRYSICIAFRITFCYHYLNTTAIPLRLIRMHLATRNVEYFSLFS